MAHWHTPLESHGSQRHKGGNGASASQALAASVRKISQPPKVCMTRGQRVMPGWWEQSNSVEVLGKAKECFQELARHCLLQHATTCRNTIGPRATTLQVLSLSDGSINEPENVPS